MIMKLELVKNHIELTPQNSEEVAALDQLWKVMSDCVGKEKKLVPMGLYVAEEGKPAMFHIEGLQRANEVQEVEVFAPFDCEVYCRTCNKLIELKAGEQIPICCGKRMEIID